MKPANNITYLLVSTDGYSIEYTRYDSLELARKALRNAWNMFYDEEMDEEWKDQSFITDDSAILYQNGENVYVWEIITVSM